ncbi:MAG: DUF1287 domain-containing protein [Lysobacteraceae bacterium]
MLLAAHAQVGVTIHYDGSYQRLEYPGGDVAEDRGVCTDVVIRAMRAAGVDLQQQVHEDMKAHFADYPAIWGLSKPDSNIDHRRVPNLETFFKRAGKAIRVGDDPASYRVGDIVSWRLPNGLPHIGIVSDRRSGDGLRPLIIHNVGAGTQVEDVLFAWTPVGHFRPFAEASASGDNAAR